MIILVDQDGPLANFECAFLQEWRKRYPERLFIALEERKTFYLRDQYPKEFLADVEAIYNAPGFTRSMPPVPEGIAALQELTRSGHTVVICTAPLSKAATSIPEKLEWIREHLGADYVRRTICTKDKTLIRGDILIDDRVEVEGELAPLWKHVLFTLPYNAHLEYHLRLQQDWSNLQNLLAQV